MRLSLTPLFAWSALILGSILVTVSPAAAQGAGVKAGVTFSTIAVSPSDAFGVDVSGRAGLLAGGYMTFLEPARLSIQVDAQAALRRTDFGDDIEDTLTYLEIPAVARYAVMTRNTYVVRALAGGTFNYLIAARESVLGEDSDDVKDAFKSFDVGVVVGAQVEWNERWVFDGRYCIGLSDAFVEDVEGVRARHRSFQITAGYRFR